MKFYKIISILLHPIVIPTITIILYFLLIPSSFNKEQQLYILAMVFITTYFIPLLILIILKALKQIQSFQVISIKERKLPLAFMIILFYLLGNSLFEIPQIRDICLLFYATSFGLTAIYLAFIFKIKISIHLLSIGMSLGFFLLMSTMYSISFTLIFLILILLSGFLASARLYLKIHSPKEVYLGFFLGIVSPFIINFFL